MLAHLQLRNFRCFASLSLDFANGFNFFVGANGAGKTSILEGACILLRLQSQRSSTLLPAIRGGEKSFSLAGRWDSHLLQFGYSGLRRNLAFDEIEQRTGTEYLRLARVVSFANTDIELVRGGSDARRRYLDFLGAQIEPLYRPTLRAYERALRSRNALLKTARPSRRQIAAYDGPLVTHGRKLGELRRSLVELLAPPAEASHGAISGSREALAVAFVPGARGDFAADLVRSEAEEMRLRQTVVGPHRDDVALSIAGMAANQFASEGQQRTAVLALKVAQAHVLAAAAGSPPLLLIDDIFGELDRDRRNALLQQLPADSQKFVTVTSLAWRTGESDAPVFELADGTVRAL
jgi:DNA replication and repair protein RecF